MSDVAPTSPEYARLLAVSARLGADRLLVQGAGGNTSLKHDGILWVKASGTWLMHAEERPIMVPVDHAALLAALDRDDPACETSVAFVVDALNPSGLRPSIETTMHAVLPQRVVLHVHCVDTIARACRADAEQRLRPLLDGLDWAFVPYVRPGLPMTRGIEAARRASTDVIVLGNHGLVVAAETVAAAEDLLAEVRRRLVLPARPAPPPARLAALAALAEGTGWRLPRDATAHAVATDPERLAVARQGSLYPDHVIFLGPGIVVAAPGERPDAAAARAGRPAPVVVHPGLGVVVKEDAGSGVEPLAGCLADVTARLSPGDGLRVFTADEEDALVNWDAEKYRQELARRLG